jgi:hypothetical protein
MKRRDGGIATATLAQLYLEQGHPDRALAICEEVLADDPTNGYALELERRLRDESEASLEVEFVSSSVAGVELGVGRLELRWSVPRELLATHDDPRLDVVVAIASAREDAGPPVLRYTSVRCRDLEASAQLDVPLGPASAAVALMLSASGERRGPLTEFRPRARLRVLAVAEPISW